VAGENQVSYKNLSHLRFSFFSGSGLVGPPTKLALRYLSKLRYSLSFDVWHSMLANFA